MNLFARVREAVSRATWALLNGDSQLGQAVVDGDQEIDDLTSEVEDLVWLKIDAEEPDVSDLRQLVGILLILPELERSADLAEHIAQRALTSVGSSMTPVARRHRATDVRGGDGHVAERRPGLRGPQRRRAGAP